MWVGVKIVGPSSSKANSDSMRPKIINKIAFQFCDTRNACEGQRKSRGTNKKDFFPQSMSVLKNHAGFTPSLVGFSLAEVFAITEAAAGAPGQGSGTSLPPKKAGRLRAQSTVATGARVGPIGWHTLSQRPISLFPVRI